MFVFFLRKKLEDIAKTNMNSKHRAFSVCRMLFWTDESGTECFPARELCVNFLISWSLIILIYKMGLMTHIVKISSTLGECRLYILSI